MITIETKHIQFEDDMVIVYVGDKIVYKGLEDYEPAKRENWVWDSSIKGYRFRNYTKYCLDI